MSPVRFGKDIAMAGTKGAVSSVTGAVICLHMPRKERLQELILLMKKFLAMSHFPENFKGTVKDTVRRSFLLLEIYIILLSRKQAKKLKNLCHLL